MTCNKDSVCETLSKQYKNAKPGIDSSFDSIESELNSVSSELNGLSVPDDYLGEKVKSRISEIVSSMEEVSSLVDAEKSAVDGHIDTYAKAHHQHYVDWQKAQKTDDENGESESTTQQIL